ncbi:hypothetical protein ACSDR0_46850 [Streptosporangium sp. G11]|uniref:hypothetical protein n=1 Tax=Streptosporangium sp. G11 TaxID=3436926 RepID=UPI003EB827B1
MRIVYSRSSTATQSLLQLRHILTEAGLLHPDRGRPRGVLLFEDPAATSKILVLESPAFAEVAAATHPAVKRGPAHGNVRSSRVSMSRRNRP